MIVFASKSKSAAFPIVVASWPRNRKETFQLMLDHFEGCNTIDLRAWYRLTDGKLRPSKKGLTVSVKHLPNLAEAFAKAMHDARAAGLLPDDAGK